MRRTITDIVLAPGRMPRLNADKLEMVVRFSEIAALVFVAMLIMHLAIPEIIGLFMVVSTGALFAIGLSLIALTDYQNKLAEYDLYGFRV